MLSPSPRLWDIRRLLPNVYEGWIVVSASALIIVVTMAAFVTGFGTVFTPILEDRKSVV